MRNNSRQKMFFQLLDCTLIFAPKRNCGAKLDEILPLKYMHETYSRAYRESPNGNCNTDWWRGDVFEYLSSETTKRAAGAERPVVEWTLFFGTSRHERFFKDSESLGSCPIVISA